MNAASAVVKFLFLTLVCVLSDSAFCQNQTDAAGKRVGYWVVNGADAKNAEYAATAKVEEGNYDAGRKVGVWKTYYPSGKLKSEITFELGRPKGPYKTYYENGQVEEEGNWAMTKQTGSFKRYHENGKVSQEFTFNESGQRAGTQKYYHENGQLMIVGNWEGGKESGEVKEFYEDGSVKSVRVFNNGQMDATKSTFKEPPTQSVAVNAEPEPVKDDNNKVKAAPPAAQADAQPNIGYFTGNGQHTLYNKNRQVSQKGEFKNGKLWNGKWYKYDKDGILTNIEIYSNGVYVGEGVIDKSLQ